MELQQALLWGTATLGLSIGISYAHGRWPTSFQRLAIPALKVAIVLGVIGIFFILASVPNPNRY